MDEVSRVGQEHGMGEEGMEGRMGVGVGWVWDGCGMGVGVGWVWV